MCTLAVTPSVLEFLSLFRYRTCNISWPLSHNFPIVFAVVYPFFFQFIYGRMASGAAGEADGKASGPSRASNWSTEESK